MVFDLCFGPGCERQAVCGASVLCRNRWRLFQRMWSKQQADGHCRENECREEGVVIGKHIGLLLDLLGEGAGALDRVLRGIRAGAAIGGDVLVDALHDERIGGQEARGQDGGVILLPPGDEAAEQGTADEGRRLSG